MLNLNDPTGLPRAWSCSSCCAHTHRHTHDGLPLPIPHGPALGPAGQAASSQPGPPCAPAQAHPSSLAPGKLLSKGQIRRADLMLLSWWGREKNLKVEEERGELGCFQAICMFISQENVTLYPFPQINFCVTGGIKGFCRWELKDGERKAWERRARSLCR